MKETIKRVEGGAHVTYSCSKCGTEFHKVFLPDDVMVGPINWKELVPERCSCGEVLLIEITVPAFVPRLIETEYIEEPGETDG